jgi:hypothetical protein
VAKGFYTDRFGPIFPEILRGYITAEQNMLQITRRKTTDIHDQYFLVSQAGVD